MSDKTTFKDLTVSIAESTGQSQRATVNFIRLLTDVIEEGLREDGQSSISGFGKFELKSMKARKGVNPTTGEGITVPEQNKVVFKPYKQLRELVNKDFSHMEHQLLDEGPDTTPTSTSVDDKKSVTTTAKTTPPSKASQTENSESVDDLVFERPSPVNRSN